MSSAFPTKNSQFVTPFLIAFSFASFIASGIISTPNTSPQCCNVRTYERTNERWNDRRNFIAMIEIVPWRSRDLWCRCRSTRRARPCPSWVRRDRSPLCTTLPLPTCLLGKMLEARLEMSFPAASPRCIPCR